MQKKRVKIFSIATNNYHEFEESFYNSFQEKFFPSYEKEFIIFTDNTDLSFYKKNRNIKPVYIEHLPWPHITLSRYEKINKMTNEIEESDLCVYADIDLNVVERIDKIDCDKYFGVHHPGNYLSDNRFSLENNISSQAYVDLNYLPHEYKYIQGCLWGGHGNYFKKIIEILDKNVKIDLFNGVVARWHDESHLNKFYIENIKDFNILDSSYAYPEKWNLPFLQKNIIHKDKSLDQFPRFEGI